MKDKTVLAVVIVAILIVGGIIGGIIINNRMVLDRQVKLQTEVEKAKALETEESKKTNDIAKADRSLRLRVCLSQAETDYWKYVELNSNSQKSNADGTKTYYAEQRVWDSGESNRKAAKDECYRLDAANALPLPSLEQLNNMPDI